MVFIASIFWRFRYVQCIAQNAERPKKIIIRIIIVEAAVIQLLFVYACAVLNPYVRKWLLKEQTVVISFLFSEVS